MRSNPILALLHDLELLLPSFDQRPFRLALGGLAVLATLAFFAGLAAHGLEGLGPAPSVDSAAVIPLR